MFCDVTRARRKLSQRKLNDYSETWPKIQRHLPRARRGRAPSDLLFNGF
jgi:hypothetical protein